jgi:hypothetical protein
MKESEIQGQILDYLRLTGFYAWRNNTGAMVAEYGGRKRSRESTRYGLGCGSVSKVALFDSF